MVPVVIGHRHEEAPREESSDEEGPAQTSTALRCPFPECPDSLVEKTPKVLVSHLAAPQVSHGQVVPPATLGCAASNAQCFKPWA